MFSLWFFSQSYTTEWLFAELLLGGVAVVIAASRLTRLADRFADERGLGKGFVGLLLLATVTSLPEVVAGAAAGWIGAVDMAFGAVYGSCSFNIVIIGIMNLFLIGGGSVLRGASPTQLLNSSFGIMMMLVSLAAIVAVQRFEGRFAIQQSIEIVFACTIVASYLLFMWLSHKHERKTMDTGKLAFVRERKKGLVADMFITALVTIAAAWWLTHTSDVLAEHPIEALGRSLGRTVVGVFFLAIATSLPEIASSVTAIRMNNLDMALGNVFGSNMFNVLVLSITKVTTLARRDPLMMSGPDFNVNNNLLAGLLPLLLTALAVAGIAYRTQRRVLRLGFDSVILVVVYILGMICLLSGT